MTDRKTHLLGSRKFYARALAIALPIMLQQLIQSLVSLIDNFMVAGLGDVCMSGVNVAGQVLFVFIIFLNTICMSGGIYLTQYYGAADREGMQQAFRFKIIIGLLAFIPYLLVCIVFPRQVLSLMLIGNTDAPAILDQGVAYIRVMVFAGLQMTISMCIATSLRDMGQVRTPLVISVISTLTNTLFNWLLIYGNLGMPRLEVRGAAFATVIARSLELILYIIVCMRIRPAFIVRPSRLFDLDLPLFFTILRKGGMVLISEMAWVFSETITTALYNGRGGADVVSGMAASFAIANLFFVAFSGITSATGVILGSTLGAGNLEEARKQKNWLLTGSFIMGIFVFFFALGTTLLIPVVFGRLSDEALLLCRRMVYLIAALMPPWVYMMCQLAVSRAGGDTAMGAYADATITVFVMIPIVFLLAIYTEIGPVGLYFCVKIIDILKIGVFHLWLRRERWLRNLTIESQ
ncbi:MAG: MATE family efflux transporter [Mogibacterium sp.]|nr:MATE family efflux transporter [Mogibacterium sp.]